MLATGNYDESQLYTKSLIGVTAMETLLGKKQFAELLGDFYLRPQGKPALAVESDKRKKWNPSDAVRADFDEEGL